MEQDDVGVVFNMKSAAWLSLLDMVHTSRVRSVCKLDGKQGNEEKEKEKEKEEESNRMEQKQGRQKEEKQEEWMQDKEEVQSMDWKGMRQSDTVIQVRADQEMRELESGVNAKNVDCKEHTSKDLEETLEVKTVSNSKKLQTPLQVRAKSMIDSPKAQTLLLNAKLSVDYFQLPTQEQMQEKRNDWMNWIERLKGCLGQTQHGEFATLLVRQICKYGKLPEELRPEVWVYLLHPLLNDEECDEYSMHVAPASLLSSARCLVPMLIPTELDLPNQRVLHVDIERTRPSLLSNGEEMEYLLTMYCKIRNISYKQGMNYILAIFYMIPLTKSSRFSCFSVFMDRYLIAFYNDEEFGVLQCCFKLLRICLLYHDPELCNYLDQYQMSPELYASPWFLTLFANRLATDIIVRMMDLILAEDDIIFVFWLSLALLRSKKELIFKHSGMTLPETLTGIVIQTDEQLNELWVAARVLRATTPATLMTIMTKVVLSSHVDIDSLLYTDTHSLLCAPVSSRELVDHCFLTNDSALIRAQSLVKYFILDCRSVSEYEAGHLPCAYSLDADMLQSNPEELARHLAILSSLKGCHFCCFFDGDGSSMDEQSIVLYLLSRGFCQLSICTDGYVATHRILKASVDGGIDLIDHSHSHCLECKPNLRETSLPSMGRKFLQSVFGGLDRKTKRISVLPNLDEITDIVSSSQLPHNAELKLLLTVVRNKQSSFSAYVSAMKRIVGVLLGHALESFTTFEKVVPVGPAFVGGRDNHHSGAYIAQPIVMFIAYPNDCSLDSSFTKFSEELILHAIEPFTSLCTFHLAYARCQSVKPESVSFETNLPPDATLDRVSSASLSMASTSESSENPVIDHSIKQDQILKIAGLQGSEVSISRSLLARYREASNRSSKIYVEFIEFRSIVFVPSICNEIEVASIVRDLNQGGLSDESVLVICIVCGRIPLKALKEGFPKMRIYAAAVDEIIQNRLSPGFGSFVRT